MLTSHCSARKSCQFFTNFCDSFLTLIITDGTIRLGGKVLEVIKSLELAAVHKGWQWCNNIFIRGWIWGLLRDWSKQQKRPDPNKDTSTSDTDLIGDATVASAIRLMGKSLTLL